MPVRSVAHRHFFSKQKKKGKLREPSACAIMTGIFRQNRDIEEERRNSHEKNKTFTSAKSMFCTGIGGFLIADLPSLVGWKTPYAAALPTFGDDNVTGYFTGGSVCCGTRRE